MAQWVFMIKWDANGGKIGPKKTVSTTAKENTEIGEFPKTPERDGFTFKGWYTKKTGGKKISVNTKPTKPVTYQAQWEKIELLSEKDIQGHWETKDGHYYKFSGGKFEYSTGGSVIDYGDYEFYPKKGLYLTGKYYTWDGKICSGGFKGWIGVTVHSNKQVAGFDSYYAMDAGPWGGAELGDFSISSTDPAIYYKK